MKKPGVSVSAKILCLIVAGLLFMPVSGVSVFAQEKIATKIKHKPLKYFVADHRIRVEAAVGDETDINLVRCYFRAPEQADFVFVTMTENEKGSYQGILPVPGPHTDSIIYIFLAANTKKQVVKTQEFLMKKEAREVPPWQMKAEGDVKVSAELGQAPEKPKGFRDSILMDQSESTVRLGGATLIFAGTGGVSAGTVAGIAAGAALVGGGIAAGSGGGDDDGNDDKESPRIRQISDGQNSVAFPEGETSNTAISEIVVEFTEAMSESGEPLSDTEQWQIGSFGWSNNTTFYIRRNNTDPPAAGTTIRFTLTGFKDEAGNALASPDNFSVTVRTTGVKVEW